MQVLIDGHNALGALRLRARTHEGRRRLLLSLVAKIAPRATVFFDARRAPAGAVECKSELGVDVQYCRKREADAAILDAVRDADAPGELIVVTNDREVAGRAAQLGARALGVVEFFGPPPPPPPEEAGRPRFRLRPHFTPADFGLPDEVDLADPKIDDED